MNVQPEIVSLVRQWVARAESDLEAAEYLLTKPAGYPFPAICFHSQQCVEKYLKALLVWRSIEPPRIHDLWVLMHRLPAHDRPDLSEEDAARLTDHATVDRYPGDQEPVGRDEAERAAAAARRVRDFIRSRLPESTLPAAT
jgi:HEPN domain-containing protein